MNIIIFFLITMFFLILFIVPFFGKSNYSINLKRKMFFTIAKLTDLITVFIIIYAAYSLKFLLNGVSGLKYYILNNPFSSSITLLVLLFLGMLYNRMSVAIKNSGYLEKKII